MICVLNLPKIHYDRNSPLEQMTLLLVTTRTPVVKDIKYSEENGLSLIAEHQM